jgi:hypothetical protein
MATVRGECDAEYASSVTEQRFLMFARVDLPESHRAVVATRERRLAIGREDDFTDCCCVAEEAANWQGAAANVLGKAGAGADPLLGFGVGVDGLVLLFENEAQAIGCLGMIGHPTKDVPVSRLGIG